MSTNQAVAIFEKQLAPLSPRFAEALGGTMPVERLIRTVVVSVERTPKLLECDRQSLFNAAMSAAVLGLEVDGVTGQAFLIPFKGKAQLVIGYKGYITLAARSGVTITGGVVREGDLFDYDLGEGWITHKPIMNNKGRVVAAWAKAAANDRPPVVTVMGLDELLAVKARSASVKGGRETPWNDPEIGFPAMCEKTAKRRLARSLPMSRMQLASRLDEAVDEHGKAAWIRPDENVVIEGEIIPPTEHPTSSSLIGSPSPPRAGPPGNAADQPAPQGSSPDPEPGGAGTEEDLMARIAHADTDLANAAESGVASLKEAYKKLPADLEPHMRASVNRRHKARAEEIDAQR